MDESKVALWFSDRLEFEKRYKEWIAEEDLADCVNNFIVFLIAHDLIDEKKTIEFLRMAGYKNERSE